MNKSQPGIATENLSGWYHLQVRIELRQIDPSGAITRMNSIVQKNFVANSDPKIIKACPCQNSHKVIQRVYSYHSGHTNVIIPEGSFVGFSERHRSRKRVQTI